MINLKRFARAPLFIQVLALMAGTFIIAQGITLFAVWRLPPQDPVCYYFGEVVRGLNHRAQMNDKPVVVDPGETAPPKSSYEDPRDRPWGAYLRRELARELGAGIKADDIVLRSSYGRWRGLLGPRGSRGARCNTSNQPALNNQPFLVAPFRIGLKQADGSWNIIRSPHSLRLDPGQRFTLILFSTLSLALVLAAFLSARLLASPIVIFARAAERLGRDPRAPPLLLHGSSEIVTAAAAFNEMQLRLRRYVDDRTAMIGAIAHDLRTPLTRLRFRIEGAPEDLRAKMSSDLDQMEAMISATMSFVRDATETSQRTKLELSSLLESLTDEMTEIGKDVTMEQSDKVVLEGDPVALKRLFSNLLENAVKYGKRARVRVYPEPGAAVVEVDDDGPGIPAAEADKVFEPFYRREPSRNRDTGGIGLGLAVVRTVARAHGGDAELINREGGGLTARVKLPV